MVFTGNYLRATFDSILSTLTFLHPISLRFMSIHSTPVEMRVIVISNDILIRAYNLQCADLYNYNELNALTM